jgi:hypothetical protein
MINWAVNMGVGNNFSRRRAGNMAPFVTLILALRPDLAISFRAYSVTPVHSHELEQALGGAPRAARTSVRNSI